MCTSEGCEGKAVAKGLCSKHYMRLRRAGDPNVTRKPGPKQSEWHAHLSNEGLSPRTRARFTQAVRLLDEAGKSREDTAAILHRAWRYRGRTNMSKFLDMAIMAYLTSLPEAEQKRLAEETSETI